MPEALLEVLTKAVLYEGYILYPYRPSVKNRQRWTFGGIYPRAYSEAQRGTDPWTMQAQCLIAGGDDAAAGVKVRFLHLTERSVEERDERGAGAEPTFHPVQSLEVDGQRFESWQEAVERQVEVGPVALRELIDRPLRREFSFPHHAQAQMLSEANGRVAGRLVREQQQVDGVIEFSAERKDAGLFVLTIQVLNQTPFDASANRDEAAMRSFASSHIILVAQNGDFISLTDPPDALRAQADACRNVGCWPVLVGEAEKRDTMLCSPIILPDYPEVAQESPGDLFDGTEIDEILTLRIMTLTDEEKRQAAAIDDRTAKMLARTEALAREQLMNLHGTMRPLNSATSPPVVPAFSEQEADHA